MNLKEAEKSLERVLDEEELISQEWISNKNYVGKIAPYQILRQETDRIETYCKEKKIAELYYIPLDKESKIYERIVARVIPATSESIFKAEYNSFVLGERVIFPQNLDFIIQTDGDDYHIFIGSEQFIETIFGDRDTVQEYIEYLDSLATESYKPSELMYSLAKRYPGTSSFN